MRIIEEVVKTKSTNCANRFGGPGDTLYGSPNIGIITLVANSAIGLNVGPARTRA